MNNCTNCGSGLIDVWADGPRGKSDRCRGKCRTCGALGPGKKDAFLAQRAWDNTHPSRDPRAKLALNLSVIVVLVGLFVLMMIPR